MKIAVFFLKGGMILRKIIWFAVLLFGFGFSGAQDMNSDESKSTWKQDQIRRKEAYLDQVQQWAEDSTLVLEARFLGDRNGRLIMVNDNNFIEVIGEQIVIQTSNPAFAGYNGLGGVTLRGIIRDYEVSRSKNSVNIYMQISTLTFGFATVNISVTGGEVATAHFYGQWGSRISFFGDVFHPAKDFKYKGVPVI